MASYKVVLADIEHELLGRSAADLRAQRYEVIGEALDVTRAEDWGRVVAQLVSRWGGLDLLVNCAGISPRGTVESTDEALWERTLGINLKGAWLGIKAALPSLRARRGTIVNIGSTRATRPMPGLFSYVVSKAGLWGLTQQVAVEYLAEGITCNMIAPGWVDTPNERRIQARYGRPDFPAGIRNLTTPEEVGAAVVYLASAQARKINGVILYLDAGLQIADDAGMVHLPDRVRPPFEQRLEGP
jgi:3-oxoacyl-[acyl-carrier protein] reductase